MGNRAGTAVRRTALAHFRRPPLRRWLLIMIAGVLSIFGTLAKAQPIDACPLGLAVSVICFDDLTDGPPTVLTNIPGATIGAGPDSASVTFSGVTVAGPFPRSYALLETGGDFNPPNSDVATLFGEHLVVFQSDIFSSPATFGPPAGTLVEDGTFQEFKVDAALDIFVRSDVAGPEGVPEPSTLALVFAGFSTLVLIGRRRQKTGGPTHSVRILDWQP
jgi:hypothetical protein